ncbi:uncharacterized protein N0V89_009429 [Didymosphaeria variabile]|uniref:U4/U6.U5 small nuclear ribonucleoprotein 27kDa protein domain-containing protein n=1 Tax=Didymosphaeria variabile TaxID=1932322 RepID=A0A9W9C6J4_9PLEO|nr:uncharacterized protein N0V89_009429 [Didymosphaeria variabile]KAJ4348057.1 hypothetical protein N0V89_009429 [Didymosphaeria variabile]
MHQTAATAREAHDEIAGEDEAAIATAHLPAVAAIETEIVGTGATGTATAPETDGMIATGTHATLTPTVSHPRDLAAHLQVLGEISTLVGPPKPPTGPRGAASPGEDEDVKMEEQPQRERPEGMDDDTWEMARVMGFARFKSTKNTKVPGNDLNYGVRREKKMEARQYMNRQGGFNRPLSPSHG